MVIDDKEAREEESEGFKHLADEGEKVPDETEEEKPESEEEEEGGEEEGEKETDEVGARLSALEDKLAEKDAEILFYRQELAKGREPAKPETKEEPLYNIDDLAKQLTNQDPRVAAKAVVDLAEKIADKKLREVAGRTENLVRTSAAERSAMDQDRERTLEDFADELEDRQVFVPLMERIFSNLKRESGGRYIKDSLYTAAATARTIIDKQKAKANGTTKNGVREVRATRSVDAGVEANTGDYSKVKTIDAIPDQFMSARERAAAKSAARAMGVKESEWVTNFFAEKSENPNFGH